MDDKDKHNDQFNASLKIPHDDDKPDQSNPAADLIRKKVEAAYAHEPSAKAEIKEVEDLKPSGRSKHQQFIYELTSSGRPLHEIQTAWHEYYAGLADREKHQVWQEFYAAHAQAAHHPAVSRAEPKPEPIKHLAKKARSHVAARASRAEKATRTSAKEPANRPTSRRRAHPAHSLLFGLGIGSITILIFMFGFFNERIIAPFIQPSRNTKNIPIILSGQGGKGTVSPAPEIIIPKINAEIPVVYGVTSTDDSVVQKALEIGVVHYADTALPGHNGNLVIVGHSSGNIFNPGRYKYAFSLLRDLNTGDVFYLQKDSKRYTYQIYKKTVVKPTNVSVLAPGKYPAIATLITCDPPGVSTNRLVVIGRQIDPSPSTNTKRSTSNVVATTKTTLLPSDSQTLWSRLVKWFER